MILIYINNPKKCVGVCVGNSERLNREKGKSYGTGCFRFSFDKTLAKPND